MAAGGGEGERVKLRRDFQLGYFVLTKSKHDIFLCLETIGQLYANMHEFMGVAYS